MKKNVKIVSKISKSRVFKLAWRIKRELKFVFSTALKMAWHFCRFEHELMLHDFGDEYDYQLEPKFWSNYGKCRAYYTCIGWSRYQNRKGLFLDLTRDM